MNGGLTTGFIAGEMRKRGYVVREGAAREIRAGAADSRKVQPGDLFAAFPGENTDGNAYVGDAIRNGAAAVVCERAPEGDTGDCTVVVAPNTVSAMAELANAWLTECGPRVVGITGTVGKTTAKELTAAALGKHFRVHKSEGNFNSREGLPLAVCNLRAEHEVSVLEMGMDSVGEMAELCRIARPEVGVVLNIGLTHVEKLGSIEAIAREKLTLARSVPAGGTAILNIDDARVAAGAAGLTARVITFGEGERATLRRGAVEELGLNGTRFRVTHDGETAEVHSPVPGAHTVPAALAAVAAGLALGLRLQDAVAGVCEAQSGGRMRSLQSETGARVLDDSYNSSPASLTGALRMLGGMEGRRIALIGKMAELGEHEVEEHRKAGAVAAETCDVLVVVGEAARPLAEGARAASHGDTRWFADKDEAAAAVRAMLNEGDVVLLKASRSQAFETLLPALGVRA